MRERRYRDRAEAGRVLGAAVAAAGIDGDAVVVGLPRGGVPVAAEVAGVLGATLDVLVVRKVGVPGHAELAMGAVGEGGVVVENVEVLRAAGVDDATFEARVERESAAVDARVARYRRGEPGVSLDGRTVVVVDDGLATGASARAALTVARARGARRAVLAVPVGAPESLASCSVVADEVICPLAPAHFGAVGSWYAEFDPVPDAEVERILAEAARR